MKSRGSFLTLISLILGLQQSNAYASPDICAQNHFVKDTRIKESEKEIEIELKNNPNDVACLLKLASLYLRDSRVADGFDLLAKAYKLEPSVVKRSKLAKILDLALRVSQLKELAQKNRDPKLWRELGDTYFDMGIFTEAANAYEESLKISRDDTDTMILLALCYGNQNLIKKSISLFQEVLKRDIYNFYANYYYGKLLKNEIGDKKEGLAHLMLADYILKYEHPKFKTKEERSFISKDLAYELSQK